MTAVTIRPSNATTRRGLDLIDEVIAKGVDVHIEDMGKGRFWLMLSKGEEEWRFWLSSRSGGALELICEDEPGPAVEEAAE